MTSRKMDLKQMVGEELYRRAGLARLSPEERAALAEWIEDRVARAVRRAEKIRAEHGPGGPPPWSAAK